MDFSLLTLLHVAVLLAVALRLFSRRNTNGSALAWLRERGVTGLTVTEEMAFGRREDHREL